MAKKKAVKSLKAQNHKLSSIEAQMEVLSNGPFAEGDLPRFTQKLEIYGQFPLKPSQIEILQVNLGYMCNQVCSHCHVDAGPDRKEIMTRENMQAVIEVLQKHNIRTLDLTGGAPEMNPDFRWLVMQAKDAGVEEIIVRSNLTIILANKKYHDLPQFFKENQVRVVSSLPCYTKNNTDKQRGEGVFDKSLEALKMLNALGYGMPKSALKLDLVYNPGGAFLPGDQQQLEADYKRELKKLFGIHFHELFTITNLPISRFLDFLVASKNYEEYMSTLVNAFNPAVTRDLMCRNTISVDYEGYLYDCDFNQMLLKKVAAPGSQHIRDFDAQQLSQREIFVHQHCYACTAGAGSSCQGSLG